MRLTKKQRARLKLKYGGKCSYCGCDLPENGWHVDHAEPVIREIVWEGDWDRKYIQTGEVLKPENNTIDNLMPSCAPCNIYKSSMGIEGFRYEISQQVERARKNSVNFRHAERFGLITINEKPIVFHFEQYSSRAALAQGGGSKPAQSQEPEERNRHYDHDGYCDNPARGY